MNLSSVLRKIDILQSDIIIAFKNILDKLKRNYLILKWLITSKGKQIFVSEVKKVMLLPTNTYQVFLAEANHRLGRLDTSVDFLGNDQPFVFRSTVLRKIDTLQSVIITALKNIADRLKSYCVILELLETPRGKKILVLLAKKIMISLTDAHQIFLVEANRPSLRQLDVPVYFRGNKKPFVVRDHFVENDEPIKIFYFCGIIWGIISRIGTH